MRSDPVSRRHPEMAATGTKVRSATPWLALGITLLLTLAASGLVAFVVDGRDRVRFENATRQTQTQISVRLQTYIAVLRAGDAFFAASEFVDRNEFREYVDHIDIDAEYPGIQGIGFARRVTADAIAAVVAEARDNGLGFYEVFPMEPPREEYYPIEYLEPVDRRNRAALGYDMFSEPVRREAMARARDTGRAAMSGRVRLVQELEDPHPQPGFLIYQPIYGGGRVPSSLAERRDRIRGFIYSPFRAKDLFGAVFRDNGMRLLAFRVYDGETTDTTHLLYDSHPEPGARLSRPSYATADTMNVAGRTWTFQYETLPAFHRGSGQPLVPLIALAGLLVSLVLYRVTRAEVLARAEAEQSEATRSRFFAAMSHELRTPINAILGYNDLLLSGVYGQLPAPLAHGIDRSQKSARHLAELVSDVLDLSRIEAGKVQLDFEPVAMGSMIEDVLNTIRPVAEERVCRIDVAPCACAGTVVTDPRRVRQILLNLLSNATKFGAGQPIGVRCANAEPQGGVQVEVTDHGPGIRGEDLERIFEEFVQLDVSGKEGTGLGLAISRRLAELRGGRLDVQSVPGEGATFRLWLPSDPPRLPG